MSLSVSVYQAEGAVLSPEQVCKQATEGRLVSPTPSGFIKIRRDGQVDIGQESGEETHTQRYDG